MTKVTQAHIDARTSDILTAAMRQFANRGIEATTMQEIAAEAGISAGAIYRYFPSKEELLRAVFADCTEENQQWFQQAATNGESPLQSLLDLGRHAWDELKDREPEHLILGLETTLATYRKPESVPIEHRQSQVAIIDMMADLIRRAQVAGEIDATLDADALAMMLQACHLGCHVLAVDLGEGKDMDPAFEVLSEVLRRLAPAARPAVLSGKGGVR